MIDPKELRIGNLTDKGIVFGICHQDGVQMIHILNNKFASISETYIIKDINPIELTEEWLFEFGFKKGNKCYENGVSIELLDTDFYLRPSFLGGFYWGFNLSDEKLDCELNNVQSIKYIHQLQNLYFAITGKELTIK